MCRGRGNGCDLLEIGCTEGLERIVGYVLPENYVMPRSSGMLRNWSGTCAGTSKSGADGRLSPGTALRAAPSAAELPPDTTTARPVRSARWPTNDSWRVDETYVRVKGKWVYLYRAVDSSGAPIDFLSRLNAMQQRLSAF